MSKLVTFTCSCGCGKIVRRPEHYGVLKYASMECKYHDKKVKQPVLEAMANRGYTRKEAAEAIGCSYPTVIRAIARFGINDKFPAVGHASNLVR